MSNRKSARRNGSDSHFMESLEARVLLSHDPFGSALPNELVYPEGFANDSITEVVNLSNTDTVAAEYEVWAEYEVGARDQLLSSGTLAAGERAELDITTAGDLASRLVRSNTPYALVVRSSGDLAATLRHDDFGGATADAFTDVSAAEWTFPSVIKNDAAARDFVVLYNPNNSAVDLTLTGFDSAGEAFTLTKTVQAQRRAGWNLNQISSVPTGEFGLQLESSLPVVAAVSHYGVGLEAGDASGSLGQADGGATAGAILSLEFEDRLLSDGSFESGDATLSILNTGAMDANVTLTFISRDPLVVLATDAASITVAANSRAQVSLASLGIGLDAVSELSMYYTSDAPVTVSAEIDDALNTVGTEALTTGAPQWTFLDTSLDRVRTDGRVRTENVFVFNPNAQAVEITIDFIFSNGEILGITKTLDPLEVKDVDARFTDLTITSAADLSFFVVVKSQGAGSVVASMEHWSLEADGGFSVGGLASGVTTDLSAAFGL